MSCRKRSYNFIGVWTRWVDIYHNGRCVWVNYHWLVLYWSEIYMIVSVLEVCISSLVFCNCTFNCMYWS